MSSWFDGNLSHNEGRNRWNDEAEQREIVRQAYIAYRADVLDFIAEAKRAGATDREAREAALDWFGPFNPDAY